jgi:hypothetical protein
MLRSVTIRLDPEVLPAVENGTGRVVPCGAHPPVAFGAAVGLHSDCCLRW